MREILGKRRKSSPELLRAALTCAERWHWPVVPGAGTDAGGGCACLRPDCPVPGAHPHDPGLLAATRDPRMVRWWWTRRPDQPLVLATGDRVSAVSLPAVAGARALGAFDKLGVRTGPVVATPTRLAVLVEPYSLEELGELLDRHEWVPTSLRYHGEGGYLLLPPSPAGSGGTAGARWVRRPVVDPGDRAPWLPSVRVVVDTLVQAGRTAPDGSRLSY
ncbi:bifunctional DNA primase/polymerase [Actinacidiphila glaucinigra]|uniref:bifunctional DNA primase/polymerase n=1 Tax=Actinacidiphila glaucinigra TaxID=235986 RepID=UPI0036E528AC